MRKDYLHNRIKGIIVIQIDQLKSEILQSTTKLNDEIRQQSADSVSSFKMLLLQKDSYISELQRQIQILNERMIAEEAKCTNANNEIGRLKEIYEQEIAEFKQRLKAFQLQTDDLKILHNRQTKENLLKYEKDKEALKEEYNKLISQVKEDFEQKRIRMEDKLSEKDKENKEIMREMNENRSIFNMKAESLQKELSITQDNLKSAKKLHELQVLENQSLHNKMAQSNKEARLLQEEVSLLEREKARLSEENSSLKEWKQKTEMRLYGKGKSPMK